MTEHPHAPRIARLDRLSRTLDTAFGIPGTRFRIGWDSLIGLVPGIGDALAFAPAAYIVLESHRMGLPRAKLVRQGVNCVLDLAVGSVPLIGDLFDMGFKANRRNVAILRDHFEQEMARNEKTPATGEGHLSSHHPQVGDPGGSA
ncbi:DUF4112 domain-containing protein [Maribius pontilimi]|uniref:DUF4112 domain-containing protein n=1 Tax=Palleronia pontilimi TaxID=1964209 RepID=A0A934I7L1_9RHOB|nr:DUF4112 domain-containing protein [Palleronia pontilimi]MBJ3761723.1 DUF4112 domain-containing protein [Palleronia pontilimi]